MTVDLTKIDAKKIILISSVVLVVVFLAGRYSGRPAKITETSHATLAETVKGTEKDTSKEAEKKNQKVDQDTVMTETDHILPSGEKIIKKRWEHKKSSITASVTDTTKAADKTENKTAQETIEKSKITVYSLGVTFGPMIGYNFSNFSNPMLGAFASKTIAGPFSVGAWGFATPNIAAGLFGGFTF